MVEGTAVVSREEVVRAVMEPLGSSRKVVLEVVLEVVRMVV
jgi:hypothetical protein